MELLAGVLSRRSWKVFGEPELPTTPAQLMP